MASMATETSVQLVPLCRFTAKLKPPIILENTPSGTRYIIGASSVRVEGERFNATLKGETAGDWLTVSASGVGTLDVRATLETDDGALVFVHYNGRVDMAPVPGNAPIFIAPLFDTGDPRYAWLAKIQAVGKGVVSADLSDLVYEMYEVR